MALKYVVMKRVIEDILGSLYKEGSWKVLILDHHATRIISACCKMSDVMAKGITLVEDINKGRQPLPKLEAIYVVIPNEENIAKIIEDFSSPSGNLYKLAHIYFLEKCSTTLFSKLGASKASRKIGTLKEANMSFLPYESKVFTLDYPQAFADFYTQGPSSTKTAMVERIADQVSTVCAMLGEYPAVRYRSDINQLAEIAEAIQSRLDAYKADKRDLGTGDKSKSQLIILDRGFDVITPILHELTYQAMVYDLIKIDKDVYTYRATTVGGDMKARDVILDENDAIWVQLRHMHIAEVSTFVSEKFQEFADKKHLKHQDKDKDVSIKNLSRYIKAVPQYQKELSGYSLHINLVDQLLKLYKEGGANNLSKVANVEQDLAMGSDTNGDPISDALTEMMPLLFEKQLSSYVKIRMLILYILFKKGVSNEDFQKLVGYSDIPSNDRKIITNLMHLGHKILTEERVSVPKHRIQLKERLGEKYAVSRWTPVVQDIAEYAVEGRLDDSYAAWLRGKRPTSGGSISGTAGAGASAAGGAQGTSVRQRWNWIPGAKGEEGVAKPGATASSPKKSGPTIIIFVVGGMTYSEMRAVYEATAATNVEVIIGSTHIISPKSFLDQLKTLKPMVAA